MKNVFNLVLTSMLALLFSACASSQPTYKTALKEDVKIACNVSKNGIENVIAKAKAYNEIAKKYGLEFRRLNVNNSDLIKAVEEGIKTNVKKVNPKTFKGKKSKTVLPIEFAAQRACKFAISALTQHEEAKTAWRLAVPGDGFKY